MACANARTRSGSISKLTAGYVRPPTAPTKERLARPGLGSAWPQPPEHTAQEHRPERRPRLHDRRTRRFGDLARRVRGDDEAAREGVDRVGRLGEGARQPAPELERGLTRPALSAGPSREPQRPLPNRH